MIKLNKLRTQSIGFGLIILVFVVSLVSLVYLALKNIDKFIDNAENGTVTTVGSITTTGKVPTSMVPPPMQMPQICPNNNDIVSVCSNYDSCCKNMANSDCYCSHPAVGVCKSQYDACMTDSSFLSLYTQDQRQKLCQQQRGECCQLYSSLNSVKNYKSVQNTDQKQDQICSMSFIGIQKENPQTKCATLCSTNPNCVAYSIGNDDTQCKMFSSVNPIDPVNPFVKQGKNVGITYYQKQ